VPVGQVVIEELASHLAAFPSEGPLFVDEVGDPLPYWRWKRLLAAATGATGVEVTAHGFRHFAHRR
jgi:integrase